MAQSNVISPGDEAQRVTESALLRTVSAGMAKKWAAKGFLEGLFHVKETRGGKPKSTLRVLRPRERGLGILRVLLFTQVMSSLSFQSMCSAETPGSHLCISPFPKGIASASAHRMLSCICLMPLLGLSEDNLGVSQSCHVFAASELWPGTFDRKTPLCSL